MVKFFFVLALLIFAGVYLMPGDLIVHKTAGDGLMDALVFYMLGLAFLLSYYYEGRFWLCKVIMGICVWLTWPPSRKWAFVYCAGFWVIGTIMLF